MYHSQPACYYYYEINKRYAAMSESTKPLADLLSGDSSEVVVVPSASAADPAKDDEDYSKLEGNIKIS
jgi:hypothetical protein